MGAFYPRRVICLVVLSLCVAGVPSLRAQSFSFVNTASSGAEDQSYSDSSRTTADFPLAAGNLLICFARAVQNGSTPLAFTFSDNAGNVFSAPVLGGNQGNLAQWEMSYSITTGTSSADAVTVEYGNTAPYGALLCGQFSVSPGWAWAFDSGSGPAAAFYTSNGTTMTTPVFSTTQAVELIVNCDTSYDGGLGYYAGTIGGVSVAGSYFNAANGLGNGNDEICQYLPVASLQKNITSVATISSDYNPWGTQVMSFYARPTTAPVETPLSISLNLPSGTVGQAYSGTATATGGTIPYTYSSSSLPAGLALSASSGSVSGGPTGSGTFSVIITATDSSTPVQTVQQSVPVVIAPAAIVVPPPTTTPTAALTLYWTPVNGATGYIILRGTSPGTLAQLATSVSTSYVDANVTPGSSYYYEVESVAPDGATSLASQPLYITVP